VSSSKGNSQKARRKRLLEEQRKAEADRRKRTRLIVGVGAAAIVILAGAGIVVANGNGDDTTATPAPTAPATSAQGNAVAFKCTGTSKNVPTYDTSAATGSKAFPAQKAAPPKTLTCQDLKVGSGAAVADTASTFQWNYSGASWSTGVVFDENFTTGTPTPFALDAVIEGWRTGLIGMKPGGKRELVIPAAQAYGAEGRPPSIAPNATLVFVVELVGPATG
jgi:peptidylprolyl isomerase